MSFVPYLNFDGTTTEAMTFYAKVFDADDLQIFRFGDAEPTEGMEVPPDYADRAMNATLTLGDQRLMASDYPPGMPPETQAGVSVAHTAASRARAEEIYAALSEGGEVTMPFGDVFWADGFGMCKDRFGTHWMVGGPPLM